MAADQWQAIRHCTKRITMDFFPFHTFTYLYRLWHKWHILFKLNVDTAILTKEQNSCKSVKEIKWLPSCKSWRGNLHNAKQTDKIKHHLWFYKPLKNHYFLRWSLDHLLAIWYIFFSIFTCVTINLYLYFLKSLIQSHKRLLKIKKLLLRLLSKM